VSPDLRGCLALVEHCQSALHESKRLAPHSVHLLPPRLRAAGAYTILNSPRLNQIPRYGVEEFTGERDIRARNSREPSSDLPNYLTQTIAHEQLKIGTCLARFSDVTLALKFSVRR
jgi:hypothetical protein